MSGQSYSASLKPARPPALRRTWLFVPGADREALMAAPASGADVLIQELEDFTPPQDRPRAHALCAEVVAAWKAAGCVAAVRINPFADGGHADLAAVLPARPHIIALPKVRDPSQIAALDAEVTRLETELGIPSGTTELLPNIEFAEGVLRCFDIARASPRVTACLLAAEDLAADLGAERSVEGSELAYCRQHFIVACRAAGVVAVDCPYTWIEAEAYLRQECDYARQLGYMAKSCVHAPHVAVVNAALTPSPERTARAQRHVAAFEEARAAGRERALVDGALVEVPAYMNAKRLLARAAALKAFDDVKSHL